MIEIPCLHCKKGRLTLIEEEDRFRCSNCYFPKAEKHYWTPRMNYYHKEAQITTLSIIFAVFGVILGLPIFLNLMFRILLKVCGC